MTEESMNKARSKVNQYEEHRKKVRKKILVSDLRDNIKDSNIHVIGGPRKESERTLEYFVS